ncbi:MAG: DUF308 domain-containing protein [Candidatus Shapirobacteria bacterium]|nr:DUF308 domain-containing protein [Candidatus Shapirobacteria bacterium]
MGIKKGYHKECLNPDCPGKQPGFKDPNHPGKGGTYDPAVKNCWICGSPYDKQEFSEWKKQQVSTASAVAPKRKSLKELLGGINMKTFKNIWFSILVIILGIAALVFSLISLPILLGSWALVCIIGAIAMILSGIFGILKGIVSNDKFQKGAKYSHRALGWTGLILFILPILTIAFIDLGMNLNEQLLYQPTPTTAETTAATTEATTAATTAETTTTTTAETTAETTADITNSKYEFLPDVSSIIASTDGKYVLHDSNNKEITMDFSQVIGFTPDKNLILSDLVAEKLDKGETSKLTGDFEKYLNEKRDGFGPLAGYTDGTNDYNQYYHHLSGPQVPIYSWMIHTGLCIQIPGIGQVEGELGRGCIVLIINRTDKVFRFPGDSVYCLAGFQGWGRIWDGENKPIIETERRLVNHYLTRLGLGIPEKGFIGQTDLKENAATVTVVTVDMIADGQFRLIRAETVPAIKK